LGQHCQQPETTVPGGTSCGIATGDEIKTSYNAM
jgi:hypothetical protein